MPHVSKPEKGKAYTDKEIKQMQAGTLGHDKKPALTEDKEYDAFLAAQEIDTSGMSQVDKNALFQSWQSTNLQKEKVAIAGEGVTFAKEGLAAAEAYRGGAPLAVAAGLKAESGKRAAGGLRQARAGRTTTRATDFLRDVATAYRADETTKAAKIAAAKGLLTGAKGAELDAKVGASEAKGLSITQAKGVVTAGAAAVAAVHTGAEALINEPTLFVSNKEACAMATAMRKKQQQAITPQEKDAWNEYITAADEHCKGISLLWGATGSGPLGKYRKPN